MPKLKNILIFVAIAAVLILIGVFVLNSSSSNQASLVPSDTSTQSGSSSVASTDNSISGASPATQNFLNTLLNVKNIKLDVDIFSDPAFTSLHDSSITLVPDATIGRTNPFAQFGVGDSAVPTSTSPNTITPTTTTTPPVATTSPSADSGTTATATTNSSPATSSTTASPTETPAGTSPSQN